MVGLLLLVAVATSGQFLVVNQPREADVIVVLAGETDRRPARGLELMNQGYAPRLILDVPAETKIYQWSQLELAEEYVRSLPKAASISVCPVYGLSTRSEVLDVMHCLQGSGARRILVVTSDYHTRRAFSIFRHVAPGYDCGIAAAFDERVFGARWWQHREWAKTYVGEQAKLIWWEVLDRWR